MGHPGSAVRIHCTEALEASSKCGSMTPAEEGTFLFREEIRYANTSVSVRPLITAFIFFSKLGISRISFLMEIFNTDSPAKGSLVF